MKTIVFFGAGRLGKRMLELWKKFGIQPDFFADNSKELWGTSVYGVKVLSVQELSFINEVQILITCNQIEDVTSQLLRYGIRPGNIFRGITIGDMVNFWELYVKDDIHWDIVQKKSDAVDLSTPFSILFDLQHGLILGGVEAWVYQMADELASWGSNIKFITTDIFEDSFLKADSRVVSLEYRNNLSALDRLIKSLTVIRENAPCNIICDFPEFTFDAACIAKILWPESVNLIAVVHNDDENYYNYYAARCNLIDFCVVTCDEMEQRFLREGMSKEKIVRMVWKIFCEKELRRKYSTAEEPIRIGYAGRIVIKQKRSDLLVKIIKKLDELGIDYSFEVAGSGEYEQELKERLLNLSDKISFLGCLDRKDLGEFWKRQDIGINCSDFEGRCISRAESMAAGAVPVVTDTSSVKDDVQDGFNGFIVPVGDVDAIVEKINYLYFHREQLKIMGERAHKTIVAESSGADLQGMWNKILK